MKTIDVLKIGVVMVVIGVVVGNTTEPGSINQTFDLLFLFGLLHVAIAAGRYIWDKWL